MHFRKANSIVEVEQLIRHLRLLEFKKIKKVKNAENKPKEAFAEEIGKKLKDFSRTRFLFSWKKIPLNEQLEISILLR